MGEIRKSIGMGILLGALLTSAGLGKAVAQDWRPGPPPMQRAFEGRHGRWWNNPKVAQQVGLTADQQKKMDDIMQQHRLKLIDLNAALQKQEAIMQPLIEADQPDETKILAQIDAIAQARAELEKANARMLLGIRQVLTPDQWKKLRAMRAERVRDWRDERDGRGGMRGRRGPGAQSIPDGPPPPDGDGPQTARPQLLRRCSSAGRMQKRSGSGRSFFVPQRWMKPRAMAKREMPATTIQSTTPCTMGRMPTCLSVCREMPVPMRKRVTARPSFPMR